jgi:Flp pilus assembly protein TadG
MRGLNMLRVRKRRIGDDKRGIAAVEFAVIAPVFLVVLMGGMDFGHTLYVQSILQGSVQKAARDNTLDSSTSQAALDAIDLKVRSDIRNINNQATVNITRRFYRNFSTAAAKVPETWTDTNANGRCDASEPYVDANNNSVWDADGGDGGQGGARDITVYQATMTYPRMFPTNTLIGFPANVTITAQTVLANQPYGDQQAYGAATNRNCP